MSSSDRSRLIRKFRRKISARNHYVVFFFTKYDIIYFKISSTGISCKRPNCVLVQSSTYVYNMIIGTHNNYTLLPETLEKYFNSVYFFFFIYIVPKRCSLHSVKYDFYIIIILFIVSNGDGAYTYGFEQKYKRITFIIIYTHKTQ